MNERQLIINADDYGLSPEVNAAVKELAEAGFLGGVSVLANGKSLGQARDYLIGHPQLSAGVHLNVVEGTPISASAALEILTDENGRFLKFPSLLKRWMRHPQAVTRAVDTEWRAQIESLLSAGIKLHHADSHQHLHAFPFAFVCAVRLCREYGIPSLRLPNERFLDCLRFAGLLALRGSLALSQRMAFTSGLRCNEHFLGLRRAGSYTTATLLADIALLPPGLTELAVHPSTQDGIPYLYYQSGREKAALLDPAFHQGLRELNVTLASWADVS